MRVVIKGGQGSGSWSGKGEPRFAWSSRKGQQQHKENVTQRVLDYGEDAVNFKRKKSLKGARIVLGDVDGVPTVYKKPRKTEGAFAFRNEAVAFELSKLAGWDIVPAVTKQKGTDAFYQKYLSNIQPTSSNDIFNIRNAFAVVRTPLDVDSRKFDENSVFRVAVLDYLMQNTDRHDGNLFYEERNGTNYLKAVDNSIAFNLGYAVGRHPKNDVTDYEFKSQRPFTTNLSESPIPNDVMDEVRDLQEKLQTPNEIIDTFLSPEEKEGLLLRAKYLADGYQFPNTKLPPKPRPYGW